MQDKYLTVGAITRYLKHKFDEDNHLMNVYLKGEISNFKSHSSGHLYFSIKDETSKINAIMFASNAKKLNFNPTEGSKVLVNGRISVYEATGNYQIYVNNMEEDGLGNLYVAFEKLKKQLANEGLFDIKYKRTIPKYPTKIGVVTASTGAAVKDIISTIKRRYPLCETILFPSLVQGDAAAADIVKNIDEAQKYDLDVLIVGRGGGSIEDLWPFNEEIVARAIFRSKIPIISAVGHEIDYTIADFVADMRAPTPTGAAEMAVPNICDLITLINNYQIRINEAITKNINYQKLYLDSLKNSFVLKNPMIIYENKQQLLDNKMERLKTSMLNILSHSKYRLDLLANNKIIKDNSFIYKERRNNLNNLIDKLELLNPLRVLKRGYSLTYLNDKMIKTISEVKIGDEINVRLSDGLLKAKISNMEEKNE